MKSLNEYIKEGLLDDEFDVSVNDIMQPVIAEICDQYKIGFGSNWVIYLNNRDARNVIDMLSGILEPIKNSADISKNLRNENGIFVLDVPYTLALVKDKGKIWQYGGNPWDDFNWERPVCRKLQFKNQKWEQLIDAKKLWILPNWKESISIIQKCLLGKITVEGLLDDDFDAQIPLGKFVDKFIKHKPNERMTFQFQDSAKALGWEYCGSRSDCNHNLQEGKGLIMWDKPSIGKYGDKEVQLMVKDGNKYLQYGGIRLERWFKPIEHESFLYDKWVKHYAVDNPQELIKFIQQELS